VVSSLQVVKYLSLNSRAGAGAAIARELIKARAAGEVVNFMIVMNTI